MTVCWLARTFALSRKKKKNAWSHVIDIGKEMPLSLPTSLRLRRNKTLLSPSTKQRRNPCSAPFPSPAPVYQDLRTRHDWPLKKAIVDLPIRLKGNSKHTCCKSLSLLGSQNTDLVATAQTLLTEVKSRLRRTQAILLSGQYKPR